MPTKEQKRARILEGAARLISRYGLAKTTIEDIAKQAGLKPASVYYYFASKEEVFAAVLAHYAQSIEEQVHAAVDEASRAEDKLVAFLLGRFSYLSLLGEVAKPAAIEAYPKAEKVIAEHRAKEVLLLEQILTHGVETGELSVPDPGRLALGLATALNVMDTGFVVQAREPDNVEGLRDILDVFLKGLRTP